MTITGTVSGENIERWLVKENIDFEKEFESEAVLEETIDKAKDKAASKSNAGRRLDSFYWVLDNQVRPEAERRNRTVWRANARNAAEDFRNDIANARTARELIQIAEAYESQNFTRTKTLNKAFNERLKKIDSESA